MKKVQIGARVSVEDAEFVNLLEIEGAKTPSDKLRAIIEEAKIRRRYTNDYTGSYRQIQEQITPLLERIKRIEFEKNVHSEVLARILEWMPDFYAFCLSAFSGEKNESLEELYKYEKGAVERVTRLFEALLHQELSVGKASYTSNLVKNSISPFQEILAIINNKTRDEED